MKLDAEIVLTAAEMNDRNVWLKMRKMGIGGSEAAVIMGMNSWKSPYQLWLEKVGEVEAEDISDKEPVYWGTKLEQLVADKFCEDEGKKVRKCGLYRSNKYPFMLGSFDRLLVGEDAGLECKTTNSFNRKAWDEGQIPPSYYVQCQHYMAVSGFPLWYIACLVGGNHYVCWKIERDENDIKTLIEAEEDFWNKVQTHTMPDVDGSDSCSQSIRQKFQGGDIEPVQLPDDAIAYVTRYEECKEAMNGLKSEMQEAQNKLCALLGDHEIGWIGQGDNARKVSWKCAAGRTTIDAKRLKAELPDVYEKYSKTGSSSRRFSI